MKKLISLTLSVAALLLVATTASAAGPVDAIPTDSNPAFEDSGHGSIENVHNPALRFGYGGGIAILGDGGDHADENAVVSDYDKHGSSSLVRPVGYNN